MNKNDISTFVHFNFWANERLLDTCKQLSPDDFVRAVEPNPGWGSLHAILVHTLDTEFGWRLILQSQEANMILEASDFTDIETLQARWTSEKSAWIEYLESLNNTNLKQGYGAESKKSPKVWQTIMHVVTHGIQHRSEAAAILTGYGHSPGELDFDVFLLENPHFQTY